MTKYDATARCLPVVSAAKFVFVPKVGYPTSTIKSRGGRVALTSAHGP